MTSINLGVIIVTPNREITRRIEMQIKTPEAYNNPTPSQLNAVEDRARRLNANYTTVLHVGTGLLRAFFKSKKEGEWAFSEAFGRRGGVQQ